MPRLFIAAWPPPAIVDLLEVLPRPDEPGVRWIPPEQWHVTLRFLGSVDRVEADEAMSRVEGRVAEAHIGPEVDRLSESVIVVPVAGLDELAAAVVDATGAVGQPPDPRGFTGHITLARLRPGGACGLVGHRVSAVWPVQEIALVSSEHHPDRARYVTVARRRLDDSGP